MNRPFVSVIIPFYNRIDWLEEAVNSVLDQTYKNFEIIIINDGSKENDTDFINRYRNQIIYIKTKNQGPAAARNEGIKISKGEFIAFLDSDDLWIETKLEKQLLKIKETNAIWCHTGFEYFGENIKSHKSFLLAKNRGKIFPLFLASFKMVTPAIMIKSDILKGNKHLRFSEQMRFGQDDYLWLNLSVLAPVEVVPEVLVKVRLRGTNAATRARVRLQVASQIWDYIKSEKTLFINENKVDIFLRSIYFLSSVNFKFIRFIEKNITDNKKTIEFISKILFIIPFLSRRLYAFIYIRFN